MILEVFWKLTPRQMDEEFFAKLTKEQTNSFFNDYLGLRDEPLQRLEPVPDAGPLQLLLLDALAFREHREHLVRVALGPWQVLGGA